MLKKISLVVTAALFASNSLAATSGFYVGADAGLDNGETQFQQFLEGEIYSQNKQALSGYVGGLHAGYETFLAPQFVLGTELFVNYSTAATTYNEGNVHDSFKKLSTLGISILPGWQVDNHNRLFTRVGIIQSTFKHNTNAPAFGPDFQTTRAGVETGIGWLTYIRSQTAIRVEYDHIAYAKITNTVESSNYIYRPSTDQFILGVNYHFAPPSQSAVLPAVTAVTQGAYIGIDTARSTAQLDIDSNNATTGGTTFALAGYAAGLHAGYRWPVASTFSVAAEAFALTNSATLSWSANGGSLLYKFHEKESQGLSLLPGYQVSSSSLVYARLGIINSRFSYQDPTSPSADFNTQRSGVQWGLGYEQAFTAHWHFLGEYDQAKYSNIHTTDGDTITTYHPTDNLYKVGVNYYF